MADLSTAIEYDRLYPVRLRGVDGKENGVVINVVSKDSRRVVDALRKAQNDKWAAIARGENTPDPDVMRITLIACIDSWDWGEHSWGHISGAGPASLADREFIVDHPNSKFFMDQIAVGTANIENFTQPLQKNVPRGSKKT